MPERVPGSSLVRDLLLQLPAGRRVYLFGALPGVAEAAAARIHAQNPGLEVVGAVCPDFGFERNPAKNDEYLGQIEAAHPDLLIIGLGCPKQELWVHRYRQRLQVSVSICAGATLDFLAGTKARAPRWVQRIGLEWVHRMMQEPGRLGPRYAQDLLTLPVILADEWRGRP